MYIPLRRGFIIFVVNRNSEDYDSIEEYSPEQDTWKTLAIKLPQPMSGHFTFVH